MATLFDENRFESEIDSKVKNIVKNELPKSASYNAVVIRKDSEGIWWVRLDGSEKETPVLVNKVDMSVGDIVTVTLRDHVTYADGNITSPPMSASNTQQYVGDVVAHSVKAVAADIGYLKADVATIGYAQIEDADITNARIQNLVYEVTQNITHLNASDARILELETNSLTANSAVITNLQAGKADIDAANINTLEAREAWLDQIMVQTGMITSQGNIFYLDAIQVNASSITAGTIDVQRLVVTDPDTGDKHLVEWDSVTEEWVSTKLDGDVIQDLTITADKIVAGAITADKITTQNIVGSGGWINLRNGTFQYVNANSGQGISWDGTNLHISGSVTVGGLPMDISEVAGVAMDTLIYDTTYVYDNQDPHEEVTFTAHLYRGDVDIKESYPENCFTWWLKSEDWHQNEPMIPLTSNGDYTCTLTLEDVGYGATVVGRFEPKNDAIALDDDDNTLVDDDDVPISVRTPTGDYVRVSELEVETTIFDADKMLLVTSEGEKLATIATLKEVFGTSSYEDLDDLPSIEGVTLIDDKSFPDLGIFKTDQQGYDVPDDYTLSTMDINALWANAVPIGG